MAKSDESYAAMVVEFVNMLTPFAREELETGTTEIILAAKNRRWPALGVVHGACEAAHDAAELLRKIERSNAESREDEKPAKRDRSHLPSFLQNPPVKGVTTAQRQCDYYRIQVFRELQKRNALYEVDDHGAYIWTPARVSVEGNIRYTENTGQQPPDPDGNWW